tara:strand:+ start:626 stop:1066 length:441 start_codon:yes stop_codon:yes gene_type:complete
MQLEIGIAIGSLTTGIIFMIINRFINRPTTFEELKPTIHDRFNTVVWSKLTKQGIERNKNNFKSFTQSIYGWDKDDEGNLTPNWDEQAVIDEMRRLRKENNSWSGIARILNEKGLKGKRGGNFGPQTVKRTMENPFHDKRTQFKEE